MGIEISSKEVSANLRKPEGKNGLKVAEFMNKVNANFYIQLQKNVEWKPGMKILEIGFGNANHVDDILLNSSNAKFTGVDYSKTMVDLARENNPDCTFFHKDIMGLDLAGEQFDLIYTINTVYFLCDLKGAFLNLKKHLKQSGELHIGKRPKEDMAKLKDITSNGFIAYSNEEVVKAVMDTGLDISSVVSSKDPEMERKGEKIQLHTDFIIAAHGN